MPVRDEEGRAGGRHGSRPRAAAGARAAALALAGFGFWILVVVTLPILTPDAYDPIEQSISALSLVRFGGFMDAAFVAFGLGSVSLALGLCRSVDGTGLAPLLLAVCGLLWGMLGFFETGAEGTGAAVHDAAATASFLLILVVMFVYARTFRGSSRWRSFAHPTAVWGAVAAVALCSIPALGEGLFGISERLYVAAFVSWLVAVAVRLLLEGRTSVGRR